MTQKITRQRDAAVNAERRPLMNIPLSLNMIAQPGHAIPIAHVDLVNV